MSTNLRVWIIVRRADVAAQQRSIPTLAELAELQLQIEAEVAPLLLTLLGGTLHIERVVVDYDPVEEKL